MVYELKRVIINFLLTIAFKELYYNKKVMRCHYFCWDCSLACVRISVITTLMLLASLMDFPSSHWNTSTGIFTYVFLSWSLGERPLNPFFLMGIIIPQKEVNVKMCNIGNAKEVMNHLTTLRSRIKMVSSHKALRRV